MGTIIMTIKNGSITSRKHNNKTRFNAQKQYKGERYSKLFDTREDAQEWLDDLAYLGATDFNGHPTRKDKAAQIIIDEIDLRRVRNQTPTMLDCINLFVGECDTPSAAKYVIQLKRFTSLLNTPINEVSRLAFEMELDGIQEKRGLSDGTRNRYQAAFSSFFKFLACHKEFKKYQLVNPTKDVPRGKEGKGRMLF